MNSETILYIHYDAGLAEFRELIVGRLGYHVVSVVGSAAARRRAKAQHFDLFIVGHAAPYEERRALAEWLKTNVPGVPVLALCPAPFHAVDYGDYRADAHNPDAWLRLVQEVLEKKRG